MLVSNTITKKLIHGLVVLLVIWIRHPCTVGNGFFCVRRDGDEFYGHLGLFFGLVELGVCGGCGLIFVYETYPPL